MSSQPSFFNGEVVLASVEGSAALFNDKGKLLGEGGSVWITNFRFLYRFYVRVFCHLLLHHHCVWLCAAAISYSFSFSFSFSSSF